MHRQIDPPFGFLERTDNFIRSLGSYPSWKRNFLIWGTLIIALEVGSCIAPTGVIGATAVAISMFFGVLFVITNLIRNPRTIPATFPFVIVLILQLWSMFTAVYANRYLGRPIRMGRADLYLLQDLIPGLVAYLTCLLIPSARRILMYVLVGALALSAFVAWLQFARFPPALALSRIYTYKSIDNWDGHPGIRAVGLSAQPNHLGFEALLGLSLVCARLIQRPLTSRETALAVLFGGAAFFTQSRAAIIPLALVLVLILIGAARHDRSLVVKIVLGMVVAALVSIPIAEKRLQYLEMTTSGNDASYQIREDTTWAQVQPILSRLPVTGIGPSVGLFEGTGPEDKWVPLGRPVESAYLLFRAMYGIPGLVIMISGLVGSAVLAILGILKTKDPLQKQLLAAGVICCISLGINAFSFDTFDTYIHLPLAMILAGMAAVSYEERARADSDVQQKKFGTLATS